MAAEAKQIGDLEEAILGRARSLADEQRSLAKQTAQRIQADYAERLRLREEREASAAKAAAERVYHRKVQAGEIRMQADLDRLRWELVQSIVQRLRESLKELVNDDDRYIPLMRSLLKEAAESIERQELIAEVSTSDHGRLSFRWDNFAQTTVPGKTIRLAHTPVQSNWIGGLLVYSEDKRICVDNTFQGRIARMEGELYQSILTRLLPSSATSEYMSLLFHG
ncbi:MAG: V-type ATP synthase subunit E [Gammaproteobacteria bacterium]|nr:V-type ATP synthase subunit E [Gammaproteobacteria bacterium]